MFVSIVDAESGNLAIRVMATTGMYLGWGDWAAQSPCAARAGLFRATAGEGPLPQHPYQNASSRRSESKGRAVGRRSV